MSAPSPFRFEQAMSVLLHGAERLADDPELGRDEAMLADILGSDPNTADAMDVLHRVLRAAVEARDLADAADARAKQIGERRDRYKKRAETLRGLAFAAMDALGTRKVELPDLTASLAEGRPAVMITDEAAIPPEYTRTVTTADKTALLQALRAGTEIPGAALNNGIPSLQIRTK
ncbi:MAG: siphovirus Gp157 family protein [Gemmatimonadaceae bacterium]